MWLEIVSHEDDCANEFPLPYGVPLKGTHQQNSNRVAAKPLHRGAVYEISTTSGATGYGGGKFIIGSDGRVQNLKSHQ
jgi:hypothetical protein